MLKARVSLENIEGFNGQLADIVRAVEANLEKVAEIVYQEAKTSTAFKDKNKKLRPSIRKRKSRYENGGYIVQASGKGQDKGYHAHLVEFGHVQIPPGNLPDRRVPAKPFMRPALEVGLAKALILFRDSK